MKTWWRWSGVVVVAVMFAACGGGGGSSGVGSTDVEGLDIAGQLSLVEAQDVASPSLSAKGLKGLIKALTTDTSTPYYTDPQDIFVWDPSMEALDLINEILCSFDQTGYAEKVNEGDYVALVNAGLCSTDKSTDSGNESSSETVELEEWTINSSRADDNSDQIVKAWIVEEGDEFEPPSVIHAKMTIEEGASDSNPYGCFHMDFAMMDESESFVVAQGYLETVDCSDGQLEYQFSMTGADFFPIEEAVHAVTSSDGSSGQAITSHSFSGEGFSESGQFEVGFNASLFHAIDNNGGERCLARDQFDSYVYRYGVYAEDGSRLELESPGFGIKFGEYHGWASYWGIWIDDAVTLASGDTVVRANHDETSGEEYTVLMAPGKLVRHTREDITLADVEGASLRHWDNGTVYQVEFDGSNLNKTGVEECGESGCTFTSIDAEALTAEPGEWVNFWMEGLGSLNFEWPQDNVISGDIVVQLDINEIMNPDAEEFASGDMTLYCYQDCLRAPISEAQINWEGGESPFFERVEDVGQPHVYSISSDDMTLTLDGEPVVVDATASVQGQNQWGVNSGAMVSSTDGLVEVWDVWGQDMFYTWETGPNQWNKLGVLVDSGGAVVVIDQPIGLNYTHTDGVRYRLQFEGAGELHGMPWIKEEGTDRWYPAFSIADGSEVSDDDGTLYYVKALDMEQRMQEVDVSNCSSIDVGGLDLPEATYTDPDIGARPDVDSDPIRF
ncbi:MAG: hypothetical protein HY465_04760 [Deltaproteobacteria bacterium]|nr:hypothetical protein [Deltaproteobacteria bacterium]